jgi:hypothetical protein
LNTSNAISALIYERKSRPLAPRRIFLGRVFKNLMLATAILGACLAIGVLGYHYIAKFAWIDSLLNASMILSGMGPVGDIKNDAGKVFASAYALFSGVAFITNIGILLAPAVHRMFHALHLEEEEKGQLG